MPVTLLNTINKIWATIVTNRIAPILNLITKDNQCAYKSKRSTMDAIFYAKQQFMKNGICGNISFDLSKAFDRINRNKLWWILYEKGIPVILIHLLWLGHDMNLLQGKRNGALGGKYIITREFSKVAQLASYSTPPLAIVSLADTKPKYRN